MIVVALFAVSWSWSVAENPASNPNGALEATLHPPPQVETILRRSCYNCHSNSTHWPWFVHFRPFASKIRRDVADGRKALNFSEWQAQTGGNARLREQDTRNIMLTDGSGHDAAALLRICPSRGGSVKRGGEAFLPVGKRRSEPARGGEVAGAMGSN